MRHSSKHHTLCDACGKSDAQIRRISRSYVFVIENVPVVSCPHCGESYLTAETLHEIERIKLHRKAFAQERCIDVATFS
ncbi:MAG: type II toxin-antitoxin system MqsA family antitoxin [Planctomycetes bacterium]|nr:type II toxin-antitoxin system MqsA family antitoxin [Planctomycetota bacterium]